MRHFLDFHATRCARHDYRRGDGAVHEDAQVKFALNVQAFLDQQALHNASRRTGLRRHQRHAHDGLRKVGSLRRRLRQLHASRFAASSRMDLRLDDNNLCSKLLRHGTRLFGRGDHFAARRRYAEFSEDFLCLIFVDLHRPSISARIYVQSKLQSL